jgi:cobalt/nickel transport system permease protein
VVLETLLSGKAELPFAPFALLMLPIHLAIGVVEGFVTAGVVSYVRSVRPELLEHTALMRPLPRRLPVGKLLTVFAVLAVVIGGGLTWFASTHPDGLEWAVERVTGKRALPEQEQGVAGALKGVQETTSILPDYGFRKRQQEGNLRTDEPGSEPGGGAGTPVAGIVGAAIVLVISVAVGIGIRLLRRSRRQVL